MNLRAFEQERELKRQRTSKACEKQSSCCSDRLHLEEEGNRNEENEEAFSPDQADIAVTEGEEIKPNTVKDAECQTASSLTTCFRQAVLNCRIPCHMS